MSKPITLDLPVTLPYCWAALMDFLGGRAIDGVESVHDNAYVRTLRWHQEGVDAAGWMRLAPALETSCLRLTLSPSLASAAETVRERVAFFADAHCDPAQVAGVLGKLSQRHPGLRVPGAMDGFELVVRAVLGQQITVRAARTLAGRFAVAFGQPVDAPGLTSLFPRASDVAALRPEAIAALGVITARARAIVELAQGVQSQRIALIPGAPVEPCLKALRTVKGVGDWTAQYVAMRALGWRDAFPHGDLALRKALGGVSAREALARGENWRPFRAYAVMHLWRSLAPPHAAGQTAVE